MDREILFRGKRKGYSDSWVEGFLAKKDLIFSWSETSMEEIFGGEKKDDGTYFYNSYPVRPETVGQYTGLKDVFGKKIYEGDIVEVTCKFKGKVEFENCGVVEYKGNAFELNIFTDDEDFNFPIYESVCNSEREDTFIVIGNIHDNPELLEDNND